MRYVLWLLLVGCQSQRASNELDERLQRMVDQDRCAADDTSEHFRNKACNQAPPTGVRAFRATAEEAAIPIDHELLEQGRERFELFCATCHGLLGDGQSEVAENMELRKPPAMFDPRVRALADAELYRVVRDGYGLMPGYANRLQPKERWAVVAYARALALSQAVPIDALSPREREEAKRWLP